MQCPACGADNIAGAEQCDSCLTPFAGAAVAAPPNGLGRRLLVETVSQLSPKKPLSVSGSDNLQIAIALMIKAHTGSVLVKEGEAWIGILTERDVLKKMSANPVDLQKLLVRDYMTPNPETIQTSQSIAWAINKMSVGGYRHLPVIENNQVIGIISVRDILSYFWK